MFRGAVIGGALCAMLAAGPAGLCAEEAPAPKLPIRKVVLYKQGVGYFEREGTVSGNAAIPLRFNVRDMSDLLKSLTVLDLDGGAINAITYESTKTVDQQLGEYTFDLRGADGLPAILVQMKGSEVAVRVAGNEVHGRILSVGKRTQIKDGAEAESYIVSVLSDGGVVKSYPLTEIDELRFSDPKLQEEMQNYLTTLFSRLKRGDKDVMIAASGKGDRRVFVAYVQEQPVWKVSYRIVLAPKEKPLLQAWAIVDNVGQEDWEGVSLSLVSGLPVSFIEDLYDPWYVKRPTVQVQRENAPGPVTYEAGEGLGMAKAEAAPMAPTPATAPGGFGGAASERRALRQRGAAAESELMLSNAASAMPVAAGAAFAPLGAADMLQQMSRQAVSVVAQAAGALFVYNIEGNVTIRHDHSAMLPIANVRVEAEGVSIYNETTRAENPMQAIRLKNSSDLTLEGGPVTVVQDGEYSGDALMDTIKGGEQRYLSYAVDLGTRVNTKNDTGAQKILRVRINRGTLYMDFSLQEWKTYSFVNVEPKEKTVVVEVPFREGWKLVDTDKPIEVTPEHYRFEVKLPAKDKTDGKADLKVTEQSATTSKMAVTNISSDMIAYYVQQKYIDQKTRDFLDKVVAMKAAIADLQTQLNNTEQQRKRVQSDQEQVRENLKALGQTEVERDLRNTYVKRLTEELKQLDDLAAKADQIRSAVQAKQKELDDFISGFTLETNM